MSGAAGAATAAGAGAAAGGAAAAAGCSTGVAGGGAAVVVVVSGCFDLATGASSLFDFLAFLVLSYTPGIWTVPRSGSMRMVFPPYSKVYWACAALLASNRAATAKSFVITAS